MKRAVKMVQSESEKIAKAMEKAAQTAEHLRQRAAVMTAAAQTTREKDAADLRLLETRVMLGKDSAPRPGEKVAGALGARMYAACTPQW